MYRAVFNQNKISASSGVGKSSFKGLSTTWNFTTQYLYIDSTKSQVITEQGTVAIAEPVESTFNLALKKLTLKKKSTSPEPPPQFFFQLAQCNTCKSRL